MAEAKAAIGDMVTYYTHKAMVSGLDETHWAEDTPAVVTHVDGDSVTLFLFTIPPTSVNVKQWDPKAADPEVTGLSYWRPAKAAAPDLAAHYVKDKGKNKKAGEQVAHASGQK